LELLEVMVGELHGVGGRDHGGQCVLELLVLVIGLIRAYDIEGQKYGNKSDSAVHEHKIIHKCMPVNQSYLDVEVCAANNSREAPLIQYFLYDL